MSLAAQKVASSALPGLPASPVHMDAARALLQSAIFLLPKGRARAARGLSRVMRTPFVATVSPRQLGVRIVVDPRDGYQMEMWLAAYQPHLISFLCRTVRPGCVVLCAGLQVGLVAALARRLSGPMGRVLSAEPDAAALVWARRNLALGDATRDAPIDILEGALSDTEGEMDLYQSAVMGHSSLAAPHHPDRIARVLLKRGDDWLRAMGIEQLDVMVLDVEGWELHALRGLRDTIARSPGLVALVECSGWALKDAGSSPPELIQWFVHRGFDVRWASDRGARFPFGVWGARATRGIDTAANDILCLGPAARAERAATSLKTTRT